MQWMQQRWQYHMHPSSIYNFAYLCACWNESYWNMIAATTIYLCPTSQHFIHILWLWMTTSNTVCCSHLNSHMCYLCSPLCLLFLLVKDACKCIYLGQHSIMYAGIVFHNLQSILHKTLLPCMLAAVGDNKWSRYLNFSKETSINTYIALTLVQANLTRRPTKTLIYTESTTHSLKVEAFIPN